MTLKHLEIHMLLFMSSILRLKNVFVHNSHSLALSIIVHGKIKVFKRFSSTKMKKNSGLNMPLAYYYAKRQVYKNRYD